jgi:hypothetical protein
MTSPEYTLWLAYYALEGWPEQRDDYRHALNAWTTASVWGGKAKLEQFIPKFEAEKKVWHWESTQAYFMALARGKNG